MSAHYAWLFIWSIGMFTIIGVVISLLTHFVRTDTWDYDEKFIWLKKVRE
ncbi:hypothetical protein I6N90_03245 [Paenibacillus sp. GSMTC-2017]|nr:hypothetical protein [Paenibacillus sp. GSMTC-2017]MBH5316826.1 hypothetical protein [Paenibacillus sp. GSMTC-2017]